MDRNINACTGPLKYEPMKKRFGVPIRRKRVYICSPYSAPTSEQIEENCQIARAMSRLAVSRGHWPIAPHLLLPQYISEDTERELATGLGLELIRECDELWVLSGRRSAGMIRELEEAYRLAKAVRFVDREEVENGK